MKLEWGSSWQNFIPDICNSAQEGVNKCENALNILKLLSEEVFDFSKGTILQSEQARFKSQMMDQFSQIFSLCFNVLQQEINTIPLTLHKSCLRTLQAFLSWIPLTYIFHNNLVETLISRFIQPAQTRVEAIKCFTEIACLQLEKEIED